MTVRTITNFDRAFDQIARSFSPRPAGPIVRGGWQDDEYVLTVDLPGVPASAVEVSVTGNTLRLSATADEMTWQRDIRLGSRLDPESVRAQHVDGRLTVRIATHARPEARSITVETTAVETPAPAELDTVEDTTDDSTEAN